jgi:glycosyltransferase involved in cell wall biosynthesis
VRGRASLRDCIREAKGAVFYVVTFLLKRRRRILFLLLRFFYARIGDFVRQVSEKIGDKYAYIIGVEPAGACAARLCRKASDLKVLYFNMELFQFSKTHGKGRQLKRALELIALAAEPYVVLQSRNRADTFLKANRFVPPDRILLLPVASGGRKLEEKTDYFRKVFAIPRNKTIVLYAGNIIEWAMCHEIVESVRRWPPDCELVLHTYRKDAEMDPYVLQLIERAAGMPVHLSVKCLDHREIEQALASADIALLFYRELDENFTEIAFSSNKLAEYLRAGLPIISNSVSSLKEIIDGNRCGVTVEHPWLIGEAIASIRRDPETFRSNAFGVYERMFDFSKHFERFYLSLAQVLAKQQ